MIQTLPYLFWQATIGQSTIPAVSDINQFNWSGFFQIISDYWDKYVVIPFNASKVGIALGGLIGECPSYVRVFICVAFVLAFSGILIRIIIDLL